MDKVIEILQSLGVDYMVEDAESVVIPDVGGQIYEMDGNIAFVHGNREPSIDAGSPLLEKWVKAYVAGNEDFEIVSN